MKIYYNISDFKQVSTAILTIGTFDGVHQGHRKLLSKLIEIKKIDGGETVVLTFDPHPRLVLFPDQTDLKLITTTYEKIKLLEACGIDHLIIHPFSKEFSAMNSKYYVETILRDQLQVKKLVIGYDHRFGNNREGNIELLKNVSVQNNFTVEEIPAKDIDNINISSTLIRKNLELGNIEMATKFLGHEFFITGKVIEGKKLGRTIGYPTANIEVKSKEKIIPKIGVYAVTVKVDEMTYKGMLNIGINPTTDTDQKVKIEVHIFDFNKDVYDKPILLSFHKYLRDEIKFPNLELLKEQLYKDQLNSLEALKHV